MKLNRRSRKSAKLLFLAILTALGYYNLSLAFAASGVQFQRTVTFSENADTDIDFRVVSAASGTQTVISIEIGTDNPGTALDPTDSSTDLSSLVFEFEKGDSSVTYTSPLLADGTSGHTGSVANKSFGYIVADVTAVPTPDSARIYEFQITHDTDVLDSEDWKLSIRGMPTAGTPPIRTNLKIDRGIFIKLYAPPSGTSACPPCIESTPNIYTMVGATGTGTGPFTFVATTVTENGPLPPGTEIEAFAEDYADGNGEITGTGSRQSADSPLEVTWAWVGTDDPPCCRLVTFRFDVTTDGGENLISQTRKTVKLEGSCCDTTPDLPELDDHFIYEYHYPEPIPPPSTPRPHGVKPWPWPWPCLSCPREWKEPPRNGYIREIFRIRPLTESGAVFGKGLAEEFEINISNGELIGSPFDVGDASYLQMIEYRDGGDAPELGYTIGEFTSKSVAVGEVPLAEANRLRDRANIATGLLVVSLIGNAILLFRRRSGANRL